MPRLPAAKAATRKATPKSANSVVAEPRKHARLGPSAFKSRELCPSYRPTLGDSPAAAIGTKLHDMMENCGVSVRNHPEFMEIESDEQIDMLLKIQDYIDPMMDPETAPIYDGYIMVKRELEIDLTSYGIPDCDFGTADLVIDLGDRGDVVDYKFGSMPVDDAEINIQGWLYIIGCFAMFKQWKTATMHFLQPGIDELSTHTFERADIERMVTRALVIAHRVKELEGKEFNPVLSNCRWCSRMAQCQAIKDIVLIGVKKHLAFTMPKEVSEAEDMTATSLVSKHGDTIYDFAILLENFGSKLKRAITDMAIGGWEIPNKKLITKRGKTTIVDPVGAFEAMEKSKWGIDWDEFMTITRPSLSGLEALVAAKSPRGFKDKEKQAARELLAGKGVITSAPPSTYLVNG
jgi:hypothetical protein